MSKWWGLGQMSSSVMVTVTKSALAFWAADLFGGLGTFEIKGRTTGPSMRSHETYRYHYNERLPVQSITYQIIQK
jgi:hypothetical protein